jgi:hypothetical protein
MEPCDSYIRSRETLHEPELLFIHRLKLGFVHPPRLPGDVNRIFRSRTGRHRCTPDCFTDLFTRFVTVSTASIPSYRCNCHNPDRSLASRPLMDPPHKWESWNHQCTTRPKNGAHLGKAIYIQLIGSCAVTNRYTSEVQSPAPGTCCFEIGWDILEGHERSRGRVLDLSLCVRLGFLLFAFACTRSFLFSHCSFWLYNFVFCKPFCISKIK